MKFELKRIAFYERMSEETNCFAADLYINGLKAAQVKNDGHGGSTDIYPFKGMRELVEEGEKYCDGLSKEVVGSYEYPQSLETIAEDLLMEYMKNKNREKFMKKAMKATEKNIVIGNKEKDSYRSFGWKLPIEQLLLIKNGRQALVKALKEISLKEGETIWNKNIPADILNEINLVVS